jgi:type I restriction-modification system DNA methylase subunit
MLDCLQSGGIGIAVVPMSCVISPHVVKAELLKVHTLEAVMSLPDDIFYPVGVVVCIVVFTAHTAHATSHRKTWFGYWKNDGFVKTKQKGRTDLYGRWPSLRDQWVEMFRNREVHVVESVMQMVTADDEWCAEGYLETDYSKIIQADFEKVVRNLFSEG